MNTRNLPEILLAPEKPELIPLHAQWLSGEGAGSWFSIDKLHDHYCVTRYPPEGKIECKGIFHIIGVDIFNIKEKYEFTYLSHCSEVNIIQNSRKHKFKLKEKII